MRTITLLWVGRGDQRRRDSERDDNHIKSLRRAQMDKRHCVGSPGRIMEWRSVRECRADWHARSVSGVQVCGVARTQTAFYREGPRRAHHQTTTFRSSNRAIPHPPPRTSPFTSLHLPRTHHPRTRTTPTSHLPLRPTPTRVPQT